jgi:dTDP-glucose 4,6-dehydratase
VARLAVLGANSFAGAGLVDLALGRGYDVLGINRSPEGPDCFLPYKRNPRAQAYRFRQLDLNRDMPEVQHALDEFAPELVVDLAGQGMVAESWTRPEQWYQTNVVAKAVLHDFLRARPWLRRYVRASTPEVYGSTGGLVREDQPYAPSTPYAVSHAAVDMSLAAFSKQYGFPVVLTRFANFFGPGQQLYRIVPRTILSALCRRKLPLHGGGSSVRAFVHVRDVAEGLLAAGERGENGETYHFSPAEFHSIREVVETVCAEVGVPFAEVAEAAPERPAKDQAYRMDAGKARERLGWSARIGFQEGIRDTVRWVRENLEELRARPWDYVHKP